MAAVGARGGAALEAVFIDDRARAGMSFAHLDDASQRARHASVALSGAELRCRPHGAHNRAHARACAACLAADPPRAAK